MKRIRVHSVEQYVQEIGPLMQKGLEMYRADLPEEGLLGVGFNGADTEVLISHEGAPGHAVGRDAGATVALETKVTPELELEGLAAFVARWESMPVFETQRSVSPDLFETQRLERLEHTVDGVAWAASATRNTAADSLFILRLLCVKPSLRAPRRGAPGLC